MMKQKRCPRCGEVKAVSAFRYKRKSNKIQGYCRPCQREYNAEWRRKKKAENYTEYRRKELGWNLARYDLTVVDYERLLDAQDGKCAICGAPEPGGRGRLFHVDHCHATGVVRGLLCHSCNTALGGFQENPDILQAAIDYLAIGDSV